MPSQRFTGFNRLAKAELVLFALLALHVVDHGVNQPSRDLPAGSGLIGLGGFVIVAAALVLALARDRRAPLAAALVGGVTVLGFLAIHIVGFGPFSDPYRNFDANALSWVLLLAPTVAAAVVAALGVAEVRAQPSAAAAA